MNLQFKQEQYVGVSILSNWIIRSLQQNIQMSKRKGDNQKKQRSPVNEGKSTIKVFSPRERVKSFVNTTNDIIYQSLQTGRMIINDPQEAARLLIKSTNNSLIRSIIQGQFQISQTFAPYKIYSKKIHKYHQTQKQLLCQYQQLQINHSQILSQQGHFEQISNINRDLQLLRSNIHQKKQLQRQQNRQLQQQAKQFVIKMKKQKQESDKRINKKRSINKSLFRAYSEDTIRVMKDKIQQKVIQKRRQLSEKVESIQKRKIQRILNQVNNQIEHWQRIKSYQSQRSLLHKPQATTTKVSLPAIQIVRSYSQKHSHQVGKSSILNNKIKSKGRFPTEQASNNVLEVKLKPFNLESKLQLPKLTLIKNPQQSLASIYQKASRMRTEKILQKNKASKVNLRNYLNCENQSSDNNYQGLNLISLSSAINHSKNLLRKSKGKSQRKSDRTKQIKHRETEESLYPQIFPSLFPSKQKQIQPNLLVNAILITPGKNPRLISLQQSWNQTLRKIKLDQIDKFKGLQLLKYLQKKLDKLDRQGITSRLGLKARVISILENGKQLLPKNNQNDQLIENKRNQQSLQQQNLGQLPKTNIQIDCPKGKNRTKLKKYINPQLKQIQRKGQERDQMKGQERDQMKGQRKSQINFESSKNEFF